MSAAPWLQKEGSAAAAADAADSSLDAGGDGFASQQRPPHR
jgi:hypothetical protein